MGGVGEGVGVEVGGVGDLSSWIVGVAVGVPVRVAVNVGDGEGEGVEVLVDVGVGVGVEVRVPVRVAVGVADGRTVGGGVPGMIRNSTLGTVTLPSGGMMRGKMKWPS